MTTISFYGKPILFILWKTILLLLERVRGVLFFHNRRMPVSFQFCTEDGLDLITLFHHAAF
jgi:hypothetical protein